MGAKAAKELHRDLESLKRNDPSLRSLDYEGIQLGNEGANSLARALRSNTNLRRLLLGHCNIGPEGLHNIVRCLCEDRLIPSRLRKLELVSCCVCCRQVDLMSAPPPFVVQSTSSSPTPQGNPIGDEGAQSLAFVSLWQ